MVRCKAYLDILNHLGVDHKCDTRTDILVAHATLNIARPETVQTSAHYTVHSLNRRFSTFFGSCTF